jgi:hypothetical protein
VTTRDIVGRAGVLAALTCASIAVHELGHFLVYRAAGIPVRITLQSVRPVGAVDAGLDHWALLAGPMLSLVVAVIALAMTRTRPSFFWASVAFTNASLRVFPLTMDLVRAARGMPSFSDEGAVALALTSAPVGRLCLLLIPLGLCIAASVLAARAYRFRNHAFLRALGIYVYTLIVGIGVVIIDELRR